MILTEKKSLKELVDEGNDYPGAVIKFCIDRKKRLVDIGEEMHYDMELELYGAGSNDNDIFGGNIVIDDVESLKTHLEWQAHPNIERNRMLGIGRGRFLTDQGVINELSDILKEWVV